MAGERAYMYCPTCRGNGVKNEVQKTDNVTFACVIGHVLGNYEQLMAMKPDMIRLEVIRKLNAGDVKTEVFVNGEALAKFNQMHPGQLDATVDNIIRQHCDGDLVIIDGMQAREMRSLGVTTGAQMLAAIKNAKDLEVQIASQTAALELVQGMFAKAGVESPV
jgi:hypothetical protein